MSGRRRYVYRPDENGDIRAVEIDRDDDLAPKSTGDLGKFEYDTARTVDGVDISSRTKLNRHLKATGTCLMHELKGDYEKAEKHRQAVREGRHDTAQRREDVGRAIYQLEQRQRGRK